MRTVLGIATTLASLSVAHLAVAAPTLRVQVDQHGDFLLIGNTIGLECAAGTPAPVVGTIASGACNQSNANVNDSSPDLYWASDTPTTGAALASQSTTAAEARSTAWLTLPPGATVTHAFLYWAAEGSSAVPDAAVTLERPGVFSAPVTALQSFSPGVNAAYQSVADVTSLVQQQGTGAYRVSGIDVAPFVDVADNTAFGGWSLVVLYASPAEPLRNLAIFDGLDVVQNGQNQTIALSGFLVPNAGFDGKLGVIAYEGDNQITGDQLFFNGGAPLSDAQNPAGNFFNGTRSWLGAPVSVVGDLPQLTGAPQSMGGVDLDVVDITSKLAAGQTSATVQATTGGDVYYLGAFVTSISTFKPDFSTSTKTATDENGGALLAGDVIRYTIDVANAGNDASIDTVVTDALPAGVTFVPGSLVVVSGPNAGSKTDALGDDQGDYDGATRTVTFRVGAGASATQGGSLAIGQSSTVSFEVTVDAGYFGSLENQASIGAAGLLGAPPSLTPTDGNGPAPGSPPTGVIVDQCASDAGCAPPTPICDLGASPHVCVPAGSTSSTGTGAGGNGSSSSSGGAGGHGSTSATGSGSGGNGGAGNGSGGNGSNGTNSGGLGALGQGGAGSGGGTSLFVEGSGSCATSPARRGGVGPWLAVAALAWAAARRRGRS